MAKPAPRGPAPARAARPAAAGAAEGGLARGQVQRVLVLANAEKRGVRELAAELAEWLGARAEDVRVELDVDAFCRGRAQRSHEPLHGGWRPDLVVVLGGDGTLLKAVSAFAEAPVPALGINFGRVGLLASTVPSRWRETLAGILAGQGVLEQRMRLSAEWEQHGERVSSVALNEIVVQRGSHQGMPTLALRVGADWMTNYRADGLILATPSGSTAYSLSAGGPILAPAVEAIVVTPICSQGLSNRPIVLAPDSRVTLTVTSSSGISTLAVDGQTYHSLNRGQVVEIARHPLPYPLYSMPGLDPYRRLRSRLGWRGSVEPDVFGHDGAEGGGSEALPPEGGEVL
jgi:NAD+ kinase